MTTTVLQSVPATITAGETISWQSGPRGYPPSDGWTLTTYFRGTMPGVNVVAIADGGNYLSTLTAEQSLELAIGRCDWQSWVARGTGASLEQHQVDEGQTLIEVGFADLDPNTPYDGRSPLEQQLANLRVSISEAAINGTAEYQIANRAKKRYTLQDLLGLEKRLVELVNAERRRANAASGAGFFKNHAVRPVEPGP